MSAGQWIPLVLLAGSLTAVAVVELVVRLVDRRSGPTLGQSSRDRLLVEVARQPLSDGADGRLVAIHARGPQR